MVNRKEKPGQRDGEMPVWKQEFILMIGGAAGWQVVCGEIFHYMPRWLSIMEVTSLLVKEMEYP